MNGRFVYLILLYFLLIPTISGCTIGRGHSVFPTSADHTASPPLSSHDDGSDRRILIANGLGESLTLVERKSGVWNSTPDIISLGQAPSEIKVRGKLCYVINSLSNSIQVIDIDEMVTVREISTGAGSNPVSMSFLDDTTAFVSCYFSNEVIEVDLLNGEIPARIKLPSGSDLPHDDGVKTYARPWGIEIVGNRCFVACANLSMMHVAGGPGLIAEINPITRKLENIYPLSGRDTSGLIYSDRYPSRLFAVSAGDYIVGKGFTGNGKVESFDIETGRVFQSIDVPGAPFSGTVGPDDILILENALEGVVLRIDPRQGHLLESYRLPVYGYSLSYASSIVALPGLLGITEFNSDRLYLLEPSSGDILAELVTGDGPDAMAIIN